MKDDNLLMENSTSKWGNKTLISIGIAIVLGTNGFNRYDSYITQNEQRIELEALISKEQDGILELRIAYEKERSDRKDERILEQAKTAMITNNYKVEIIRLERIVKGCQN